MSLVSAIKFYDDSYYSNKYYAQIGGVTLQEFNYLEVEFLTKYLNFNLYIDHEIFWLYLSDLLNYEKAKVASAESGV